MTASQPRVRGPRQMAQVVLKTFYNAVGQSSLRAILGRGRSELRNHVLRIWSLSFTLSLALLDTGLTTSLTASAQTSDPRFFDQTGFRIDDDTFWAYFGQRGGVHTFGYPVSRDFPLLGFQVQIFQRVVMQRQPDGTVRTMNLLDEGLLPYTRINGSSSRRPIRHW